MTGYYDIVLGLIPVALFGLSGSLFLAGLSLTAAVSLGGLAAMALVGHGMFVNDPTAPGPTDAHTGPAPSAGIESAD